LLAEVADFDLDARELHLRSVGAVPAPERLRYDTLIVAGGSHYSYFGHEEWRMNAAEVKSLESGGRPRWIDYRVPIEGADTPHTIHLHVVAHGEFDTGVFAYNLVKRGWKHGLRVVGTLKSEPDVNVLAIYEK
jgi:hypothetical protein